MSDTMCKVCECWMSIPDGKEPTDYCEDCVCDVLGETEAKLNDARAAMSAAHGLLSPLGNQPVPSVMAIREALSILRRSQ